ncbi:MAG: hypothetical protein HYU99_04620 [Deltaproteobacteria bacterium]|nr:hypothetical protein [Deltaproteobacteria bacterium]
MKKLRTIFFIIGGFFLISYFISFVTTLFVDTTFVPGDARRFDPVGSFAEIRRYAGDGVELLSLEAECVRSDGTIDLKADYVRAAMVPVKYHFVQKLTRPPEEAPPIGAGGSPDGSWYQPINIDVSTPWRSWAVQRQRGTARTNYVYMNLGMKRDLLSVEGGLPSPVIPPPACPFDALWRIALQQGASKEAVAEIDYKPDGYHFSIPDTSTRLHFGLDCQLR